MEHGRICSLINIVAPVAGCRSPCMETVTRFLSGSLSVAFFFSANINRAVQKAYVEFLHALFMLFLILVL